MTFGKKLKELRLENKLTQTDLGKKINISKANMSKYENDIIEPNLDTINALAQLFNVSSDYLLGRTNDSSAFDAQKGSPIDNEKTIDEELDDLLEKLASNGTGLMFKGKALSDTSKRALITSLKNAMALADQINNEDSQKKINT